jgi:hypothetical protein
MTRLFCGHLCPEKLYDVMFQVRNVRCPECGTEWRGTMVIARNKRQATIDMREAERRAGKSK